MNELVGFMIALPLVYIANVAGGAEVGRIKEQFSKKILLDGLFKGLIMYGMIGLLVVASIFVPTLEVNFNGTVLGLVEAIKLILWGGLGIYSVKALMKLGTMIKGKPDNITPVEDEGTPEEAELG